MNFIVIYPTPVTFVNLALYLHNIHHISDVCSVFPDILESILQKNEKDVNKRSAQPQNFHY
jgi:uncharacterized spore protein YtfJ